MNVKYLFVCITAISLSGTYIMSRSHSHNQLLNKTAPLFKSKAVFPDGTVGDFNLKDYIGKKIVIYFYPMDDSPGCTTQAKKFRDEIEKLQNESITVIGVSSDSIKSHLAFQKKLGLPYPLISDEEANHSISKQYDTTGFFFGKRKTFLVNKKGIIFKVFDKVDIKNQINDILDSFKKHA